MNDLPRYRINAKQTAGGLWQMDITVELHEATAVMLDPATGETRGMTPGEIWALREAELRKKIHGIGGKVVDEVKKGGGT